MKLLYSFAIRKTHNWRSKGQLTSVWYLLGCRPVPGPVKRSGSSVWCLFLSFSLTIWLSTWPAALRSTDTGLFSYCRPSSTSPKHRGREVMYTHTYIYIRIHIDTHIYVHTQGKLFGSPTSLRNPYPRSGADSKANTPKYEARETVAVSLDRRSLSFGTYLPLFRRGTSSNSVSSIRLYRKPRESSAVGVGGADRTTFLHVLSAFPSGAIIDKSGRR